ncbi:MAG: alpha/beta fold hydrolase [Pseudomonadota bacterium]
MMTHRRHRIAFAALCLLLLALAACQGPPPPRDEAWRKLIRGHEAYLDLGGWRLHYVDLGGEGRPVMLVHGFADSAYCWHRNVTALAEGGFRPILVDQPGMGTSDAPPQGYVYSIENQAAAVWRLADSLGLGRVDLIGSSMGGGIVLYLGLRHPDRVERVVALDPAGYKPAKRPASRILTWPVIGRIASALMGKWTVRRALRDVYHDQAKVSDTLVEEYYAPMHRPGYKEALGGLAGQFFSDEFDRMTGEYAKFKPRLLIIWGDKDTWLPPDMGRRLRLAVPGSRLEMIPNCGHLPHQETPAVVNPLLLAFLMR